MSEREELAALLAELPDADVSTLLRVAHGLRVTMAPAVVSPKPTDDFLDVLAYVSQENGGYTVESCSFRR